MSKAALDKLVEAWRTEHPEVGFTRVTVGDCVGGEGESMTQFANEWDSDLAIEVGPIWFERGLHERRLHRGRRARDAWCTTS